MSSSDEQAEAEARQAAMAAGAMQAMDDMATMISVWTGVRSGFIVQGWNPGLAEQMTVEIARMTAWNIAGTIIDKLLQLPQPPYPRERTEHMRHLRLASELLAAAAAASVARRAIKTAPPRAQTPDVIGSIATLTYTPPARHGNGWLDITWATFAGQKAGQIRIGISPDKIDDLIEHLIASSVAELSEYQNR